MSVSFLGSGKTVLLVSDEALYIYSSGKGAVALVGSVAWTSENVEAEVVSIIAQKCGRKPILILNDMVEQHYRKEKIVTTGVGLADKANMVKRKLNASFPGYPVRAALPLKAKIKRTENQLAADVVILAAVPNSNQYNLTMSIASRSLVSVSGYGLLPVEASDMVLSLQKRVTGKSKTAELSSWCVFIGQHPSGGLRQVVVKNGELALTRITPVSASTDPERWSSEVSREFEATMSYLARFGYEKEDSLDVIVVSGPSAGDFLSVALQQAYSDISFYALTAGEAAKLLGLKVDTSVDEFAADYLHVAWCAKKQRLILPMRAQKVDQVKLPRQLATAASALLFCSAIFLSYQTINFAGSYLSERSELKTMANKKSRLQADYDQELAKKAELGYDIQLIQATSKVYDSLLDADLDLEALIRRVGSALGPELHVDSFLLKEFAQNNGSRRSYSSTGGGAKKYELFLNMSYPPDIDIVAGNDEVKALSNRLQENLPDYRSEVLQLLKDYEYTEGIVVVLGDEKPNAGQGFTAEIRISGPYEGDDQ